MFVDDEKIYKDFDMVENYDLHTLFQVTDEEKSVSECTNLVMDGDVKEIIGTCGMDESIAIMKLGTFVVKII